MSEVAEFDCDRNRANFDGSELSLAALTRLAKAQAVGPKTLAKLTHVAEASRNDAVEAAKAADHPDCLGQKACQLTIQDEPVI